MSFRFLKAVVFDWAGTVVDFGSVAPMDAFVALFESEGLPLTVAEARGPMGLPKWSHIEALLSLPHVATAWAQHHGRAATAADVDRLLARFEPINLASIATHSALVPGAAETVAAIRAAGLRVGSTTGYTRPIMDVLQPLAASQGFAPEHVVCAGDLLDSRPSPLGLYANMVALGVWPAHAVVKVDDTVPGLLEGSNAGSWTVAVLASGNACGLQAEQWVALSEPERAAHRAQAQRNLAAAEPDFCIDTVADLLPVLREIDARLAQGGRPRAGAVR
jgi:phosphonoacetaldehyde hydrolase